MNLECIIPSTNYFLVRNFTFHINFMHILYMYTSNKESLLKCSYKTKVQKILSMIASLSYVTCNSSKEKLNFTLFMCIVQL
jgi:hypothetical protein